MTDLYSDLGIAPDADQAAIDAAYRAAAKRHHPDVKGGDPEKFARASNAALVLRDPAKRARYDSTGETENGPDNTKSAMVGLIIKAFDQAMQRQDFERIDIIASMRANLYDDRNKVQAQIDEFVRQQGIIAKAKKRLRWKGKAKGGNFIANMMDQRHADAARMIAEGKTMLGHIDAAIAGLEDFMWEFDRAPVYHQTDAFANFATGTWTT